MNLKVVQLWRHSVKYIERELSTAASPSSSTRPNAHPTLSSSSHEYEWHLTSEKESRHVVTTSAALFFPSIYTPDTGTAVNHPAKVTHSIYALKSRTARVCVCVCV